MIVIRIVMIMMIDDDCSDCINDDVYPGGIKCRTWGGGLHFNGYVRRGISNDHCPWRGPRVQIFKCRRVNGILTPYGNVGLRSRF